MKASESLLSEAMKDPAFVDYYEKVAPLYDIGDMLVHYRCDNEISQQELAELTGTTQANISKLENATMNPSINYLQKIMKAMGIRMKISFEPIVENHLPLFSTSVMLRDALTIVSNDSPLLLGESLLQLENDVFAA